MLWSIRGIAVNHQGMYISLTVVRDLWQHKQALSSGCHPLTQLVYSQTHVLQLMHMILLIVWS